MQFISRMASAYFMLVLAIFRSIHLDKNELNDRNRLMVARDVSGLINIHEAGKHCIIPTKFYYKHIEDICLRRWYCIKVSVSRNKKTVNTDEMDRSYSG